MNNHKGLGVQGGDGFGLIFKKERRV